MMNNTMMGMDLAKAVSAASSFVDSAAQILLNEPNPLACIASQF